ncbi:MAG: restriction endonuclease subunit S [Hassallia sp. WJT32-NPBG1]|jgi:type I restriction enzyme S subunit|nr:restriction endonuclease subunit S [Hassallia sp. WJT32-NPBG1]
MIQLIAESRPMLDGLWQIPNGWEWRKIAEIAKTTSGGTPSRKNPEYFHGKIPWVKSGELEDSWIFDTEEKISQEAVKKSSAKIFPEGTLLMAMYGATVGKLGILGVNAATNQAVCAIFTHDFLDRDFLFYYLKSRRKVFLYQSTGGAQPNISQAFIKEIKVPTPSALEEQKKIVARIESLLTEVNDSRRLLNQMYKEANQMMDIVLEQVYGELEKSQFPVMPLGSLLSKKPQYGTSEKASENPEGTAILRMGNIKTTGKIYFDNLKYIQLSSHDEEKYLLKNGDILFNRTNSAELVGKSAVFESDMVAIFASYLIRLTPDQTRIKSKYLNSYINSSKGRAYIQTQLTRAIGQVNVNAKKLAAMPVPLPDTQMQERIIAYFDTIQKEVEEILKLLEQDAKLLDMLEQSILERAFRGEL